MNNSALSRLHSDHANAMSGLQEGAVPTTSRLWRRSAEECRCKGTLVDTRKTITDLLTPVLIGFLPGLDRVRPFPHTAPDLSELVWLAKEC